MAGSPNWKIFDDKGKYQAACKEPEAAACLMNFYGDGSTIRYGHQKRDIAWTEGVDGHAFESFDEVADRCRALIERIHEAYKNYQR